ncbi:MAG TPA: pantetheine-phosphate adenylyltransferase [Lachnospiraceae bacterium]|jgi:pantetheine-phosphate adenylyltransferase|uniref:pantetheine-phosphate adenylyltransferase n=1 Tax=Roseburia sp. AM59-24XD TaxID=2293138 RepID=UPI000E4C37D5|nr:pantetheine-phosphate adenylyltransferase [Roseburia sp. AM59-24XD]MBS5665609.1 pantetheine-phosphate adenylyltransferase [Roseburia sp.]RHP85466.1 pantetheine-phosphate adenylyltransferase [Roseburia sp. AM59-24XD]HCS14161.1 pantetheine-phosphate adenylyltransferase [Lachnospiraceae bacterium]
MSTAVFPGSFDPVTTGHVDLIRRASRMFDRLVVGVLVNSAKQPLFSKEERVAMLREITADQDNIEVSSFEGLLVDFVKEQHADAIVRGLRTPGDFEYELPLAQANHKLSVQADTIFLASAPEYSYISSSAVRELLRYQADISGYVPETVLRYMREHGVVSN